MFGKPSPHRKGGFREDLNCFFRSTWEANFARALNFLEIKWEYENQKHRVYLGNYSYLPDFYLPENNLFIEIKGYLRDRARKVLELLSTIITSTLFL